MVAKDFTAFRFFSIYVDLLCNKYPTYLPTYLPTYSHLTKLNSASRPRPRKPTYLPFASYRADLRRSRKNETQRAVKQRQLEARLEDVRRARSVEHGAGQERTLQSGGCAEAECVEEAAVLAKREGKS